MKEPVDKVFAYEASSTSVYRKLTSRRHLGDGGVFLMAAVQIFFSQFRIKAYRDVGCFHEKKLQEPVALFADPAHPLLSSG